MHDLPYRHVLDVGRRQRSHRLLEHRPSQRLGEGVGHLILGADLDKPDVARLVLFFFPLISLKHKPKLGRYGTSLWLT